MPPLIFVSYHRGLKAAIKNDISIEFISVNMSPSLPAILPAGHNFTVLFGRFLCDGHGIAAELFLIVDVLQF